MKNILKKFLIISIAFITILNINIVSRAEDVEQTPIEPRSEVVVTSETEPHNDEEINETHSHNEETITNVADTLGSNLFSFESGDVTVDKDVFGDAFICASGTVTINAVIYGNAFICAPKVVISENGVVNCCLFNVAKEIEIAGIVNGNTYSATNIFTLKNNAYINLDSYLVSEKVTLDGAIYRSANITAKNIEVNESTKIAGDFNYTANEQVNLSDSAVGGKINYLQTPSIDDEKDDNSISDIILSIATSVAVSLILFAVYKYTKCKIPEYDEKFTNNLPKLLAYGLLGLFVTPIVAIVLIFPIVTLPFTAILLALYGIFIYIAPSNLIIALSAYINNMLQDKIKLNDTLRTVLIIAVICIAYKLIQLIPFLGGLVTFLSVLGGLGIIVKSIFFNKSEK